MPGLTVEAAPAAPKTQPEPRLTATSAGAGSAKHMSVGESVTRGALALLSTQPLTWGASLLTTAFLPVLLGATAFGELAIAITISQLVATATGLGVSELLVRRTAQHPEMLRRDLGVALLMQTVTMIVGALIVATLFPIFGGSLVDPWLLYLVFLSGLIAAPAQTVLLSAFRGRELHRQYAWFNALTTVSGQLLGLLVLALGGGVYAYALVFGVSTLGTTALGWKISGIRLELPSLPDGSLVRELRTFALGGLPFLTWQLTAAVTQGIDRVILGLFVPAAQVGAYAAAYRIFAIPVFIPTLIMTPLFPALSRSIGEPAVIRRTIAKTLRVVLLLMVPLTAGTIVIAPAIPSVLGWPPEFQDTIPLIAILSLQLPIVAVDMVFGAVLFAIGLQGRWVAVAVTSAALKILVNLVAIPLFESTFGSGAIGASLVTLGAELFMFVAALILIPKQLLDARVAWHALRVTLAGVATVLVGAFLLPFALAFAIAGGAVAFFVVAFVLRALTLDDIEPLRRLVQARLARTA